MHGKRCQVDAKVLHVKRRLRGIAPAGVGCPDYEDFTKMNPL
jgi:hypothetical protein